MSPDNVRAMLRWLTLVAVLGLGALYVAVTLDAMRAYVSPETRAHERAGPR